MKKTYITPCTTKVKVRISRLLTPASPAGINFDDRTITPQDEGATGPAMGRGSSIWDDDDDY